MCVCLYVVKEETLGRNRKILDSLLFCFICPHCWCCCRLVAQSCRTLCDPMDCSPPGSSVHGISQARMLEWVAMPCSRASSLPRDRTWISCVLCIGSWILYHWVTWEALFVSVIDWLFGKDPDAGKDRRQEEKGTTEDEMVGWHHRLNGHEFERALGVGDGQGSLACCSPWGRKELDMTDRLNWTERLFWEFNWMST